MRPTPEFLSGLIKGQRVIVDNGAAGRVMGRVADITPKLIIVRMAPRSGVFCAPMEVRSRRRE